MKKRLAILIVAVVALAAIGADAASGHGYRHGRNLSASEIKQHPSWIAAPGHICNRDFQGDVYVTYDEDLGWILIWKCVCTRHPNGITYICWWRIERVLPENVTNTRILREMREVMVRPRLYSNPVIKVLRGGYVFRRHAIDNSCHWHNPKPKTAIVARRIG